MRLAPAAGRRRRHRLQVGICDVFRAKRGHLEEVGGYNVTSEILCLLSHLKEEKKFFENQTLVFIQ